MRVILYDYETEKVRNKVRKNLKKVGVHVQWSVFESLEHFEKLIKILQEEEEKNFRISVFRINSKGKILKIGTDWEKMRFVF
ncbi:CRISPR-associated endonuclease Cas2 [Thermodesulfobacterium sp. TA1]|uniref:CRISPR-associated endonuclease Cas2 n=1 Tax=Thermodesulfobacterium sp. TA1 TaxID=2234087 RepID=UPI00143D6167|nr:CRISPR-associated endonuclease Cas2 [Thermodesulfobacterium sp. TA1]